MSKFMTLISTIAWLATGGCATLHQPSDTMLNSLPVVTFGETAPANKEFVLYFPAGKPISTKTSIKGNLFVQDASGNLDVALRRDIYVYKNWVSYDRKTWLDGQKAISSHVTLKIPGHEHPEQGLIQIQMDEKQL